MPIELPVPDAGSGSPFDNGPDVLARWNSAAFVTRNNELYATVFDDAVFYST